MSDELEKDEQVSEEPEAEGAGGSGEAGPSTEPTEQAQPDDPSADAPGDGAPEAGDAPEPEPQDDVEPAPVEPDPEADLPRKERLRLQRSRRPHVARPPQSPEDREAERQAERARKARLRRVRRDKASEAAKTDSKGTGTPPVERIGNRPKTRQGVVVSSKADKTVTVRIDSARRHRTYEKIVRRSRTLHVHDESNQAREGDVVRVIETRPISKTKRWRLEKVVEKAQ